MKKIIYTTAFLLLSLFYISCDENKMEPFDQPFFYIHVNNLDAVNVQSSRNETVEYKVNLSSKMQYDPITLTYQVLVGDGLKEGVDFELPDANRQLVFKPGFFEMTIRVRWINHAIDTTKDNTLKIKLTENDKNILIGYPGPDKRQSQLTITKTL
ncbi:Uncharacterised protein [Sphingobacterium spiritivorum]|uniref:DUF4843 domain-containing protein n=1 Tax=Sphingobacterium spiritivorum TaxID=258 RepID=A0A380CPN8_SPHSI|nr:hypothetical protein [Sphingobacterium spiritivorum]SUJ26027.1 Uncharacterised protein [Sphingobacterium spiritivorum]